jgi:levanase/fructan beta-fructosidase
MTVALPGERKVQFYSSLNLKDWNLLSEFGGYEGDIRRIWECPSLTPLPLDGNPAKIKWLLMLSSGNQNAETGMQYFIGDFDGKSFTNNYPSANKMFVDYGSTYYAAIPWNNLPNNQHTMIGWLVPTKTETYPWRGQMSIPRDIMLKTTRDGIKLYQKPAAIVKNSLEKLPPDKKVTKQNVEVNNQEITLNTSTAFNTNTNWIEAEFTLGSATDFGFKIAQKKDNADKVIHETVIGYNTRSNELYISHNANGLIAGTVETVSVKPADNKIKLEVLLDKSSLEIFANGGEKVITTLIFPEKDATQFSLFAKDGSVKADSLKMWDLNE